MSDWQPNLYMAFAKERTQPSIDLAQRIGLANPGRVIDIGCGPGNSTQVLGAKWPGAEIVGLDASEAMLAEARARYPDGVWICADACGDLSALGRFDAVFSNAAIQWMPSQETLLPKLFGMLNEGGILAVQVPCTRDMPSHAALQALEASPPWRGRFSDMSAAHMSSPPAFYYDILSALPAEIDLWSTDYYHVMGSHADIVKWSSSTMLRPYFDCLPDETLREEFLQAYERALSEVYPIQPDGKVLFPFTRIFFTAKKI